MRRRSAYLLALLVISGGAQAGECVVLLHGLARTAGAMEPMQQALEESGFATANVDYPSRAHSIEELAPVAVEAGVNACRALPDVDTIHFVTHSLGGILLRWYLAQYDITGLGRVVMLGPPNQGSIAADRMRNVPGYDWLNGPIGRQLGKGEDSVPLALPAADFELGIIAGNRTIDPITSVVLPDPDDGRVSVEDTKLEGMTDFVIVEHSHAFLMSMSEPIKLTVRFLESGAFGTNE